MGEEEVEKEDEQEEIADGEAQRTHEEEEERRELQAHEGSEEDELVEVEQSPQHLEGDLAEVRGGLTSSTELVGGQQAARERCSQSQGPLPRPD